MHRRSVWRQRTHRAKRTERRDETNDADRYNTDGARHRGRARERGRGIPRNNTDSSNIEFRGGETKRQSGDYCDAVVQEGETLSLIRFGITGRLQTNGDWNEIQNQEGRRSDSVLDSATWVRTRNETLEAEIIVIRSTLTFRYTPEMTRSEERCPNAEIVAGG